MKVNKMWLDGKPNQNPLGTSRANRNVVLNKLIGSITNEKGNTLVDTYGEPKGLIGVIVLDNNDFIVFIKKAENHSEIGYVDSNLNYKVLLTDIRLGFSYNRPIHGEFQRNTNGDIIIAYTDGVNFRYFNKDKVITFESMNVFSDARRPDLRTNIQTGGNLPSGTYYIIASYEKDDKVVGNWVKNYNPIYITTAPLTAGAVDTREGSLPNVVTNKAIHLEFSNVDTRYSKLRIGVVFQANNVRTAFYIKSISITGQNLNTIVNTLDDTIALGDAGNLDEIIIDNPKFKTVKNITQLQNTLYIQGLERYTEPILQPLISKIEWQWDSKLININTSPNFIDHGYNNQTRHFAHGEVYAIYVRLEWSWGFGQWWHSPGRASNNDDKANSVDGYLKYQTDDTCSTDGTLSYWENLDEPYPNTGFYPAGNVRHIKTPSIKWMKENYYQGEPLYGSGKLDVLNLKMKGNTFNLNDFVDCDGNKAIGFQVGYAKRNRSNGLIAGQTIFVAGADRVSDPENIYGSLGFNANHENPGNANRYVADLTKVRTYDFESLFDKSVPNINYVKSEVILQAQLTINLFRQPGFDYNNIRWGIANFTNYNSIASSTGLVKVNKSRFIINNTILENIDNRFLEDTIALDLQNVLGLPNLPLITGTTWGTYTVYTHLISLLSLKRNCYSEFFNQTIVVCDETASPKLLFGGDTYINYSNINTFGTTTQPGYSNTPSESNDNNTPVNGTRIANLFISENRFNIDMRFVNPGVQGNTYHHPHDPAEIYLPRMVRDREANLIASGYNTDYNAQNDLEFSDLYNPNIDRNFKDTFEIRASSPIDSETNIGDWIKFKLNDVYPLVRTRGEVIFLGAGKDYLIIHHKNALFRTRVRTEIQVTGGTAFTGQGDIFANDPEEIIYDKVGALGTQHRWACYISKFGYFWIDSEAKKVYKYDGQVTELSTNGLANFFENNLECNNDNPFNSFGFHIVIDELNDRLLLTKKHATLTENYKKRFKGIWKSDQNFINSLQTGDIIMKDGKYVTVN